MLVFKTKSFFKWQTKEMLKDNDLLLAIKEMENGLIDADLGGGLIKKRIRRSGSGKSCGYRTLVATNRAGKWFFVYGFAKNEKSNINKQEETALKQLSKDLLLLSNVQIRTAVQEKVLVEVVYE